MKIGAMGVVWGVKQCHLKFGNCPNMSAIDIIVSNTTQLLAAVQGATAATTILLAPGEYDAFHIDSVSVPRGG